jgi:hypothetical protein
MGSEMKRPVIRIGACGTLIANRTGSWVLLLFLLLISSNASAAAPTSLLDGHWTGAMTREGKSWAVNLDIDSSTKNPAVLVDLIDYGIYALPFSLSKESNKLRLERKQPTGPPVLFEGVVEGETFSGSFSGLGVTAPFALKRTNAPPSILKEEEVSFRNGQVTLAGTVLIPTGPGPHPAIVCTHGSGPEGRQRAAYHSNGYFFARLGFVTLIYDKRGLGGSTGDFQTVVTRNSIRAAGLRTPMLNSPRFALSVLITSCLS